MERIKTLDCLLPDQAATVSSIQNTSDISRRFRDIGIIEGTKIYCILKSPFGDPSAYLIRGALIAIRSDDAQLIAIKNISS